MSLDFAKPQELSENELEAVRNWFSDHKDEFSGDFKEGLRKLIGNEEKKIFLKQLDK